MPRAQIPGLRCARCGWEWVPRRTTRSVVICPRCKSPYWDREGGAGVRSKLSPRGPAPWQKHLAKNVWAANTELGANATSG